MKITVLTVLMAAALPFGALRAGTPEFVLVDGDSASADEVSGPADASQTRIDPRQTNGILAGKTIFQADPKYGDICLQTIFGKVNGAQIRVTW